MYLNFLRQCYSSSPQESRHSGRGEEKEELQWGDSRWLVRECVSGIYLAGRDLFEFTVSKVSVHKVGRHTGFRVTSGSAQGSANVHIKENQWFLKSS